MCSLEYERKMTNHLSLGLVGQYAINNEDFNNDYNEEELNISLRGRYYFKHFITHSFLYLFFDDNIKVRYYVVSSAGYSYNSSNITKRFLNNENNFVIARDIEQNHNALISFGAGMKLLTFEKFTIEFSTGGGNFLSNNNDGYDYIRFGFGYQF